MAGTKKLSELTSTTTATGDDLLHMKEGTSPFEDKQIKVQDFLESQGINKYFATVIYMQNADDLKIGMVVQIGERANSLWDVIAATTNNGYDILDGASSGVSLQWREKSYIPLKEIGAALDGSDESALLTRAVTLAQANTNTRPIIIGEGILGLGSTITISGANRGIPIIGLPQGAWTQGSVKGTSVIRWIGGASAMFDIQTGYVSFEDLSVENFGNGGAVATYAFDCTAAGGGRFKLKRVVVGRPSGASQWTNAVVRFLGPVPYSIIDECEFLGAPAPDILEYDGNGSSNVLTKFEFTRNICATSTSLTDSMNCIRLVDEAGFNLLKIKDNTFNCYNTNEICVLDTEAANAAYFTGVLEFSGNEYDAAGGLATRRVGRLKNINNAKIYCNQIDGSGVETAAFDLTTTFVNSDSNELKSFNGPMYEVLDSVSRVYLGHHKVAGGQYLINDSAESQVVQATFPGAGATVQLEGDLAAANQHTIFEIDVTDGTAFQISIDLRTSGGNFFTRGQMITLVIKNSSGGAMGAVTFNSARFNVQGGGFTTPADGFQRSISFYCHRADELLEWTRQTADVAQGA